jgi:hypothetical protein
MKPNCWWLHNEHITEATTNCNSQCWKYGISTLWNVKYMFKFKGLWCEIKFLFTNL